MDAEPSLPSQPHTDTAPVSVPASRRDASGLSRAPPRRAPWFTLSTTSPVFARHRRVVRSADALSISAKSLEYETSTTGPRCPARIPKCVPVSRFQSITAWSSDPLAAHAAPAASRPNATHVTSPRCPVSRSTCSGSPCASLARDAKDRIERTSSLPSARRRHRAAALREADDNTAAAASSASPPWLIFAKIDHTCSVLSAPPVTNTEPSGAHATLVHGPVCDVPVARTRRGGPLESTSQHTATPSSPTLSSSPASGASASAFTAARPSASCTSTSQALPSSPSTCQTRTVPSSEAVTTRTPCSETTPAETWPYASSVPAEASRDAAPPGMTTAEVTARSWPRSRAAHSPVCALHTPTRPSSAAVTNAASSIQHARVTGSAWISASRNSAKTASSGRLLHRKRKASPGAASAKRYAPNATLADVGSEPSGGGTSGGGASLRTIASAAAPGSESPGAFMATCRMACGLRVSAGRLLQTRCL